MTVTLIELEPMACPESVTDAVIVCVPTPRVLVAKLAPVPMTPSRLDDQDKLAPRVPSAVSVAVPAKAIEVPPTNDDPLAGAVIVTVGGVFGTAVTVTLIELEPMACPESVTDAVIVCVPTPRVLVEKLAPVPIGPSRLDNQARLALMSPSSVSPALAAKAIEAPATNDDPFAGAVTVTTGVSLGAVLRRMLSSWKNPNPVPGSGMFHTNFRRTLWPAKALRSMLPGG